jgi:hypothetical protein
MGYFLRNLLVYGAIAIVALMLYSSIKGIKNNKK